MSRNAEDHGGATLCAASLVLVCFLLLGCATPRSEPAATGGEEPSVHRSEPRLPSAEAGIRGIITEAHKMPQKTSGDRGAAERIEEAGSQKDNVTVTKATKLFEKRGQDLTQAGFDDLKVGQQARAWYMGPVAESYPRQATASVIVVYQPTE